MKQGEFSFSDDLGFGPGVVIDPDDQPDNPLPELACKCAPIIYPTQENNHFRVELITFEFPDHPIELHSRISYSEGRAPDLRVVNEPRGIKPWVRRRVRNEVISYAARSHALKKRDLGLLGAPVAVPLHLRYDFPIMAGEKRPYRVLWYFTDGSVGTMQVRYLISDTSLEYGTFKEIPEFVLNNIYLQEHLAKALARVDVSRLKLQKEKKVEQQEFRF